jgi:hypothetical protein
LENAAIVAEWLAKKKRERTPAVLSTNVSSSVRVCLAARALGVDISGTFFAVGGEPYTQAKADIVSEVGCEAAPAYNMTEIGWIGVPCARPAALDDVHLCSDKIAVIQQTKQVGHRGITIGGLLYTTLLPGCSKLMLNVESDDYGVLEDRDCGCPIGKIGFNQHLHTIRSYDKLTSEGMTFVGAQLISVVDEILPARFGGHPTDYQFVEEEEAGLPKVSVVVGPRIGPVDEKAIVATVLEALGSQPGCKLMASQWREGKTLRVVRSEPYATGAGKILPLHIHKRR